MRLGKGEANSHPLPQGMVQVQAPVLNHRKIAPDHFWMCLMAPAIARRASPGQFLHIRVGSGDHPLLRRPISLLDADPKAGTFDFIYKVVGLGTSVLARIPRGRRLDLLGPLGHPFEIPNGLQEAFLVGGGVGIPPLYFLAKKLVERSAISGQGKVTAFLGARTKGWVICAGMFRKLGVETRVATDDGTLGYRGSVVNLLKEFLPTTHDPRPTTALYLCGPTPMMAAAADYAKRRGIPTQASLEERMGCAMGCCLGCVVEIATEPAASHSRFQRVCTEGPVFPAEAVVWSNP